MTEFGCK